MEREVLLRIYALKSGIPEMFTKVNAQSGNRNFAQFPNPYYNLFKCSKIELMFLIINNVSGNDDHFRKIAGVLSFTVCAAGILHSRQGLRRLLWGVAPQNSG